MLTSFLYTLRALKVPVGTQEWVTLMEALSENMADSSLTRFYYLARAILIKSEALYDAFDQAFLMCFGDQEGDIQIKEELLDWLNRFVDPAKRPTLPPGVAGLDLEELRRRFLQRLKEQMEAHHGGSHWIGTGGTSPFGHSGAHPSGIRIGGPGGGRMAVKVAEERRFRNYRHDRILDTRQLKVALKRLRRLARIGVPEELQMEETIHRTCQNAGDIELVFAASRKNQVELLLLMDVGGSMDPYAQMVEALFSAAHASNHFKSFHYYYFHNCPYSRFYTNMEMRQSVPTEELFRHFRKSTHVILVGDACMSPYELFVPGGIINYWEEEKLPGIEWLKRLRQHFPSMVWLNPEAQEYWAGHPTIRAISQLIKMHPLSVSGLSAAVEDLRKEAVLVRPSEVPVTSNLPYY